MTQARTDQKQFAPAAYAWLSDKLGLQAQSISLEEIRGSTSSSIYRVVVQHTAPPRCVLRVLDVGGWALEEPDLAEHEATVLIEAERAGLQAPRLLGYASHDVGFGAPVVLMSYVPGRVQLQPKDMTGWLKALAGYLASIHQHRAPHLKWRFCSWVKRQYLAVPKWAKQPQLWEQAIALLLAGAPTVQPVFIHRDYHPANVLWQGDQISGVVDWVNACQGAAGVDVAHCRINLALMYGRETAVRFQRHYQALATDFLYQPYWDIEAILGFCLPELSFYEPWQVFGLGAIPVEVLRQRAEQHLAEVMRKV